MKRPVMVLVIGVLAILTGLAQMGFGGILLGLRNNAKFLADSTMTTNKVTYFAGALLAVGFLTAVFAIGLLRGSRISRDVIGLMELCGIAGGVYAIVALDSARRSSGIGTIVGAVVVLYFLFGTDKAKSFFAKH
jgi:hypothetical protein